MTDHEPRLFSSDAEVTRLGEGLLACSLVREDWTHEAHLAACLYLLTERPDVDVDGEIAGIISRFNESVGGVNDDSGGYHDTITHTFVAGVRLFLRDHLTSTPVRAELVEASSSSGDIARGEAPFDKLRANGEGELAARVNALLRSPMGQRDWPLGFYSRALLFSVAARRGFVPPDLAPLPAA